MCLATGDAQAQIAINSAPQHPQDSALSDPDADADAKIDSAPAPPQTSPQTKDKYDDVPAAWLDEAFAFGEECRASVKMRQYYDCRCMAVRFLDKRIEYGEGADRTVLMQRIGPECADGTGIAGRLYETCKADYVSIPVGLDIEEYCTCYASTYAKMFEKLDRSLGNKQHVALMTRAKVTCRNPDAARKFYGNRRY
ncbi:MAG: hypothetical protein ACPGRX_00225 [Bdellovibrionales bacterium]